jgi:hypothetical protein
LFWAAVALFIAAVVFGWASGAFAHEWFPNECCHGRDCRPMLPGEVELIPGVGYHVVPTNETIPFGNYKIKTGNPTIQLYRCSHMQEPTATTICIFPPQPGS